MADRPRETQSVSSSTTAGFTPEWKWVRELVPARFVRPALSPHAP